MLENGWKRMYITDQTGIKVFCTLASPLGAVSEYKNLSRHLYNAKLRPSDYPVIDVKTAHIVVEDADNVIAETLHQAGITGEAINHVYMDDMEDISDDELLKELMK